MPRFHTLALNKILITKADYELLRQITEGDHSELAEDALFVEESDIGYDVYPVPGISKAVIQTMKNIGFSDYFTNIMQASIDDSCDMVRFTNAHAVESRFPIPDEVTEVERFGVNEDNDNSIAKIIVHPDTDALDAAKAKPLSVKLLRDHSTLASLEIMTEDGPVFIGIESIDAGLSLHLFAPENQHRANDMFSAAITVGKSGTIIADQQGNETVYNPESDPTPGLK